MNQGFGNYGSYGRNYGGNYGFDPFTVGLIITGSLAALTGIEKAIVTKKEKCKRVGTSKEKEGDREKCAEIGMEAPALRAQRAKMVGGGAYSIGSLANPRASGGKLSSKGCPVDAVPLDPAEYGVKQTPGGRNKDPYSISGKLYYLTPAAFAKKVAELEAACGGKMPAGQQAQLAAGTQGAIASTTNPLVIILGVGAVGLLGIGMLLMVTKKKGAGPRRIR